MDIKVGDRVRYTYRHEGEKYQYGGEVVEIKPPGYLTPVIVRIDGDSYIQGFKYSELEVIS